MDEKTKEVFRERMRKRRKELRLTQETFGEKAGVVQQSISDWERGRNAPNLENVMRLAIALNVSIDWLLGLSDKKNCD